MCEVVLIAKRGHSMNRLRGLLGRLEFHLLALLLGFVCLSWPFMSVFERQHPAAMLAYLFFIWIVLIALLFFMGRSLEAGNNTGGEDGSKGGS